MSNRRTDTTRSVGVRFNSQILAELMRYYHFELGWQISSLGGFIRDLVEGLHYVYEQNEEKFKDLKLNNIEEAEEILQQFNAGRVNQQNLSLTASQQRQFGGEVDPYYRPQTKNPRKNIRRQKRRELETGPQGQYSQPSQVKMPQEVWELYEQLKPGKDKELVDGLIANIENLPNGWEGVKTLISNNLNQHEDNSTTTANVDSDPENKTYEQIEQEQKEKDQKQMDEMKQQLKQPPTNG